MFNVRFTDNIIVHNRKRANEREKHIALHTANMWGWRDPYLTTKRRAYIAKAACRQVPYDFGFATTLAHTMLPAWYGMVNDAITGGENTDPLSPSMSASPKYLDAIETSHPGYIRELYRYAEGVLGPLATYHEIAPCMNDRSGAPGEERPTLSISRRVISRWFRAQGGKETSPIEKPLLTTEHKAKRILRAKKSLVESKRGKLFRDATIIDLTEDDQQDDGIEVHALTMDDFDDIDDINDE